MLDQWKSYIAITILLFQSTDTISGVLALGNIQNCEMSHRV